MGRAARRGERPIRVAWVIARMNVGGPAAIVGALARDLDPSEIEGRIICGTVASDEADHLVWRDPTLPVVRIDSLGRSVRGIGDLRAFIALVAEFRRFRPDIVHTHTAKAGVLGRLAAIVARVPVRVHTYHGHVLQGYFSPRVTAVVRVVERALAHVTTVLVAVGERVRDDLLEAGIGQLGQYRVIAPGVAVVAETDPVDARRALGIEATTPVVLFVGRLTCVKRPDRLLAAFAIVHRHLPDSTLLIVGDGDLGAATTADIAARHLDEAVRMLGWRSDVETLYPASDVVVLTSDNEGMPVALIEAQQAGVPCVTTDVGSAGEVVVDGETGRVTNADPDAIAAAVISLLTDDARRRALGRAAGRRASEVFGVDRQAEAHRELYVSLVDSLTRRSRIA